jgi:hypothetical protein
MPDTQEIREIMSRLDLDDIGAVVDETRTLRSGFHPLFAKDTPKGACLHLDGPNKDLMGMGWVVTDWDGGRLTPRLPITGIPAETVHGAMLNVVTAWGDVLRAMRTGTHGADRDVVEVIQRLFPSHTTPDTSLRLKVGDCIAYLLPDVPPFIQTDFITTTVTGVGPLTLSNGHHSTIFAAGRGEVARFDPLLSRIVFPVMGWGQVNRRG